jgi:hypothetical protein
MTTPPDITVRADISPVLGRVRVWYTLPTASDNGVALPVVCTPAPGVSLPIGTRTVSCTAIDRADNTVTKSFTITVSTKKGGGAPTTTNGAIAVVTRS